MKNPQPPPEKAPRPVESFGPELFAALLKGATEEVKVPMTWRQAVRFRQRVHQMREAMRRTSHPKYEICTKVRIGIEVPFDCPTVKSGRHKVPVDKGIKVTLVLSPNDSEFGPLLAAAGVRPLAEIEATTEPLWHEPSVPSTENLDTLEAMFGDLKEDSQ